MDKSHSFFLKKTEENIKRREFLEKTGCGVASIIAAPAALYPSQSSVQEKRRKYKIDLEIYEAREDTWCHKKGDKFEYPQDWERSAPGCELQ